MSDLTKIKISEGLFSARFWVAVFVVFLTGQSFSVEQVFQVITAYYVCVFLLEYPTGIIGDLYSHKWSVAAGYVCFGLSMFLFAVAQNFPVLLLTTTLYALGTTLISGSNEAMLYAISKDFKKDMSEIKILTIAVSSVAISVGSYLYTIYAQLPFFLTAATMLLAAIIVSGVRYVNPSGERLADMDQKVSGLHRIRDLHIKNVHTFKGERVVFHYAVCIILAGAFAFSLKWIYAPLFENIDLPVVYWGLLIAILTGFVALGTHFYKRNEGITFYWLGMMLVVSILFSGVTSAVMVVLTSLVVLHLVRGYLGIKLVVEFQHLLPTQQRASMTSLVGMLTSLAVAAYLVVVGRVLEFFDTRTLVIVTAVLITMCGTYSLRQIKVCQKNLAS